MKKTDLRTFTQLARYAKDRAAHSLKRNDPIAWGYWLETRNWASNLRASDKSLRMAGWAHPLILNYLEDARNKGVEKPMESALYYSRAKWLVILSRNNGLAMNPKSTGVNLSWLREIERKVS